MGCLSFKRAVRPVEIVEVLPFLDFGLEVDVAFVGEPPVEFLLVGTVRSFDLTIELRRTGFDVCRSSTCQ